MARQSTVNAKQDHRKAALLPQQPLTLASVPEGASGLVVADLARTEFAKAKPSPYFLVVCRDAERMNALANALQFFAPDLPQLTFPAWDCLPYDRVSPIAEVSARRMATLSRIAAGTERDTLVLTTINAALQRAPSRDFVGNASLILKPGQQITFERVVSWLEQNGYSRASTVRDAGEYAVRGGIIDLFAPGGIGAIRLDFFGETIETIKNFDPETQRSAGTMRSLELIATSEFKIDPDSISKFRKGYTAQFGGNTRDDALYEAISEGRRFPGMEHWLPLFHDKLETLFDYLPSAPILFEPLVDEAAQERMTTIADYFDARREAFEAGQQPLYKPLPPDRLYLSESEWRRTLENAAVGRITSFDVPESGRAYDPGIRPGRSFAPERAAPNQSLFEAAVAHIGALQSAGKRVAVAAWSDGSRDRLSQVFADHGLTAMASVATWQELSALRPGTARLCDFRN